MKCLIIFLSCVLVLVAGAARAEVSEMVLSDCFSQYSDNLMNRLASKGSKFIANKSYNSLVELKPGGKESLTYNLINLNSEYAEANDVRSIISNSKHVGDNTTNLKMFYQSKTVEIRYYHRIWYRDGQKLKDNEVLVSEGSKWVYTCSSKSISK